MISDDDDEDVRATQAENERPPADDDQLPLTKRVTKAAIVHTWDPTYPREKIGRFEGLKAIGHGSFGVVFKVRDPHLGREVALKLCKIPNERARERLLDEARLLAKLSHPNIVTVHEIGRYEGKDEFEGATFIVTELVEGITGRKLINSRPRWEDAVDFYRDAARGLAAAHAAGIVHGDLKPSNILRDGERARVVDFGLAYIIEDEGGDNPEYRRGKGTLPYMAPELLDAGAGGPLADQWALCVSLWETLEGVRPFDGQTPLSLLENIEAQHFNVKSSTAMPPRLRTALRKGLAVDPAQRWPSMQALADELDELRAQPLPPGSNGPRRLPGGIILFALLTTLGGVMGAFIVATFVDSPAGVEQAGTRDLAPVRLEAEMSSPAASLSDQLESPWARFQDDHEDSPITLDEALEFGTKMLGEAKSEADPASSSVKARAAHESASYARMAASRAGAAEEWSKARQIMMEAEGLLSRNNRPSHQR